MKVSVLVTTFRRPRFLCEAIGSVLAQNFRDFEVIVVNDDPVGVETDKVVSSFQDPRIFYIRNREHVGSAGSLNVGLRAAKGEYVAVLDDDDVWLSGGKLKKQVEFLDADPNRVLVGTNVIVVDGESGREIARSEYPSTDGELRELIFGRNPLAHSSVMFRREAALAVGGYDETLPRGKDYDLWLKLAAKGKVGVLPDYLLRYRESGSAARDAVVRRYEDARWTLEVMRRHRRDFPGTLVPYLKQWLRYSAFRVLMGMPVAYRILKGLRTKLRAWV